MSEQGQGPRIVFRADGGPSIGTGHVMRCLALAAAFGGDRRSVGFAANPETFTSIAALRAAECNHLEIAGVEEREPAMLAFHWPVGADVLVVDHYRRDASFERACRPWAKRILVLDDMANREHDADVLVDMGANDAAAYRGLVPYNCRVLVGPAFAIVHPAFRRARDLALARRRGGPVHRVLVGFGQADGHNATVLALDALQAAGFLGTVDVVLGGAAPHLADVRGRVGGRIRLHVDSSEMPALVAAADLAIGAAGTMAWERCCVGLPTIVLMTEDNQRTNVATLAKGGAILDVGVFDGGVVGRLTDALRRLMPGGAELVSLARGAAALVDGRGAEQLLAAVELR